VVLERMFSAIVVKRTDTLIFSKRSEHGDTLVGLLGPASSSLVVRSRGDDYRPGMHGLTLGLSGFILAFCGGSYGWDHRRLGYTRRVVRPIDGVGGEVWNRGCSAPG